MRCGGCITGAIIAFALFMVGIFTAAEDTPWRDLLEDLHCKDYEWLEKESTYNGSEEQIDYYCTEVEGTRRSIQGLVISTSFGISAAVFVLWSLLTRLAYIVTPRPEPVPVAAPPVIQFDRSSVTTDDWDEIEAMLNRMGSALFEGGDTLTTRLQQLEEARQHGLITDDEYTRIRRAILDRMDD